MCEWWPLISTLIIPQLIVFSVYLASAHQVRKMGRECTRLEKENKWLHDVMLQKYMSMTIEEIRQARNRGLKETHDFN